MQGLRTVLDLPQKQLGNQYMEVLRILPPPQILVPTTISERFEY